MGLEQSPAYFTKSTKTVHRAKSAPHRSYSRVRETSREKFPSPYYNKIQRAPPNLDLLLEKGVGLSPYQNNQFLFGRMRGIPMEHKNFLWDIVSYVINLQAFNDFAMGCDIPIHIVRNAIEDSDPVDGNIIVSYKH